MRRDSPSIENQLLGVVLDKWTIENDSQMVCKLVKTGAEGNKNEYLRGESSIECSCEKVLG
ncbi:hypothetical protein HNO89_003423 [Sporosarcina luteola]|nr:hypothetical protein [Sporosarcina luteola]